MISLSQITVSHTAPVATVVGVLSIRDNTGAPQPANFMLDGNAAGFFGIGGSTGPSVFTANLITLRTNIPPGVYSVCVIANSLLVPMTGTAHFIITVS